MHIEQLVTMANDIAAFFQGAAGQDEAARDMATHLRRYWDPRMRKQIVDHCNAGGAGLSELARGAIATLAPEVNSASNQR
jgi:formate dehydrogenase subunit delta